MTAHIKPAFFVTPTIKTLSYCKFYFKWIEYSRLRRSLKILEGKGGGVLKSALVLANPRQQFALWHL
ncbi:hypothetical protein HPHPP11B_0135 [Helicobacter pylori Hp P-11b]|uniref:Uncharacterized protein n=1 Tax=Helicobacter pylori Hp P-11b TaxID=992106 RepID=J0GZW3_HELPX|nr:hypothetical protein HPHPA6_0111 [Helicobacter pylori Hp A-6]EJC09350.1 hypothetical protein HPHPP11_0078 [Helicobacter pylori Hp P-11]EJC30834.1 hypothetical protein HPHPP11B_0135 [Helicobacter pylori Hp P-11b]EJC39720.1 hypothetical protein HPHPP28B_0040 [Helicobacter pylori Hp P-28b]MUU76250.1 hypothetical protein [Helicobacter pylori]